MFKIQIDNKEYGFPERLTLDHWKGIYKFDLSVTSTWPRVIANLIGCHPKDLVDISDAQIEVAMGIVIAKLGERVETPWKDPSTLTFGEWVDLDVWIQ